MSINKKHVIVGIKNKDNGIIISGIHKDCAENFEKVMEQFKGNELALKQLIMLGSWTDILTFDEYKRIIDMCMRTFPDGANIYYKQEKITPLANGLFAVQDRSDDLYRNFISVYHGEKEFLSKNQGYPIYLFSNSFVTTKEEFNNNLCTKIEL